MSNIQPLVLPVLQALGPVPHRSAQCTAGDASSLGASAVPAARAFLRLDTAASAAAQGASQDGPASARLLAAASHDLRQPLQAIGLWIELLREKVGDAQLRDMFCKIQETVHAAERVLNALLDITRLDMGVVSVNVIEFAVADLLDHVASTFAPMARDHRLELRVHPSSAIVRSDPLLLERILFNFTSNAIRHSSRGRVLVGCRRRPACLSCEVWDTGAGIAQSDLARAFEEFCQLEPTGTRRRRDGIGLGLALAQRTAALLGHPIQVSSWLGRGSCFRVDLPLGMLPAQALAAAAPDAALCALHGAFVVVVEDEREQREAAETLLRSWGCHVVAAASAAEAIAALESHLRLPNVLLVDYRLQRQETGTAAVRAIRTALGEYIPALVMTGECTAALGLHLAGVATVLPKPVHADTLRRHLVEALLSGNSPPA